MTDRHLQATRFCDHNHDAVKTLARNLEKGADTDAQFIKRAFHFVRDEIPFGGDIWQVKASDTLTKGYGACYNKNLLFMAVLRHHGTPCELAANPMAPSFTRPSVGSAHKFFSTPFCHCFTRVLCNGDWIELDPTLDRFTYDTFFKPAGVSWGIRWNGNGMPPLYKESIMGETKVFTDIDAALERNLDSWFLFKHEPAFLLRLWLKIGNAGMWKKIQRASPGVVAA